MVIFKVLRHIDVASFFTLVISAVGIVIILLVIVVVLSRIYKGRFSPTFIHSHGQNTLSVAQEASYQSESGPTIQTVGERRFYVLPERHISVIEAPPTYNDALKHPVARAISQTGAYNNVAFDELRIETEFMVGYLEVLFKSCFRKENNQLKRDRNRHDLDRANSYQRIE